MLTIFPTTNYNTNFKAASAKPNIKELEKQITAIVKDEVIIPKSIAKNSKQTLVQNGIHNFDKTLQFLAKISAIPLIGAVANNYIEKINHRIEQEAKKANALKVDSEGKTMAYRLLEKNQCVAFREIVEKYPDVLLVRTNDGCSCLMMAGFKLWHLEDSSLVKYIARKLISNPNFDPNEQLDADYYGSSNILVGRKGDTVAHILTRMGATDSIRIIASHPNIDLSIRNDEGKTPMDIALSHKLYHIVNILAT